MYDARHAFKHMNKNKGKAKGTTMGKGKGNFESRANLDWCKRQFNG